MSGIAGRLQAIRRQFKPSAVEEPIDYWFHRPLAGVFVQLVLPLPITPSQVTILSGIVGATSGVALAQTTPAEPAWALLAFVLLLTAVVLDCADGQLARARQQSSVVGRALDGLVDVVAPLSIFVGMATVLHDQFGYSWLWLHGVGWSTGICLFWHVNQYDHAKNLFLHHSKPPTSRMGDAALLDRAELEALRQDYLAKGERINAFLVSMLFVYFGAQGKRDDISPTARSWSPEERQAYVERTAGHMRAWTWMGLGTHLFLLNLAVLGTYFRAEAILVVWALILGPLNFWCLYLVRRRAGLHRFGTSEP
jgi:phosphatidylglycerophosphate synthase